jgi:DNA (cytosine-5)-methyltransferase 1
MKLLDLCCGVGGAGAGYARAGFDVTGVDLVRQPDYPFAFHIGDVLTHPLDGYDAIHASPPCKHRTVARASSVALYPTLFDPHPDLLGPVLRGFMELDVPWVIENVPGAPVGFGPEPFVLCGSMFGLRVRRHRLFWSNVPMTPPPCDHAGQGPVVGVYGTGGADAARASRGGGGGVKVAGADAAAALGIDWTDRQAGLSQAIPPAYTEWIGQRLLEALA